VCARARARARVCVFSKFSGVKILLLWQWSGSIFTGFE